MLTSEQAACSHHGDTDAWTADWHCRHCGAQWGETLVRYFRDKAAAGDHPEFHTAVADELVRLDELVLAAHLADSGEVDEDVRWCEMCGEPLSAYEFDMEYDHCYACDYEMNAAYTETAQEGGQP